MDLGELSKFITSLGVLGVLGVLLIYLFHIYIPRLQKDFKDALSEAWKANTIQQQQFIEALGKERHSNVNSLNALMQIQQETKRAIELQTTALVSALRQSH